MAVGQKTRGRPRKFDEDEVVDRALQLFWEKGYRGTTTRALESALDMTAPSIYNAFGSKQGLLLRAIDRYESQVDNDLLGILQRQDGGIEAIIEFFEELTPWLERNGGRGCLVVNLMTGDMGDEVLNTRVRRYRTMIKESLRDALAAIWSDEELVERRASLLLAAVLGLHLAARTDDGEEGVAIVAGVASQLSDWNTA